MSDIDHTSSYASAAVSEPEPTSAVPVETITWTWVVVDRDDAAAQWVPSAAMALVGHRVRDQLAGGYYQLAVHQSSHPFRNERRDQFVGTVSEMDRFMSAPEESRRRWVSPI